MVLAVFKTVALSQARRGVGSTPMHSRHEGDPGAGRVHRRRDTARPRLVERAVALATEFSRFGDRIRQGFRLELEVTGSARPLHPRHGVTELTPEEMVCRVGCPIGAIPLVHSSRCLPLHAERDLRRVRVPGWPNDGVLEIEEVLHLYVSGLEHRFALVQVDSHGVIVHGLRPEQTARFDAGFEVVNLPFEECYVPQLGVVDVNSDECEGRITNVTVPPLESTLHESHVVE